MIIREATEKDLTQLVKLQSSLMKSESKMSSYLNLKKNFSEMAREFFTSQLKSKKAVVYIAEENNTIAAYIHLEMVEPLIPILNWKSDLNIHDLFVKKEFRKKGIAKKLLQTAIKFAKKKKADNLRVVLFSKNKEAIRAYESIGLSDEMRIMIKQLK